MKKTLTVIEWAEFSSGELPEDRIEIEISHLGEAEREFIFRNFGAKSAALLKNIGRTLKL